jgi:hypothetical protein
MMTEWGPLLAQFNLGTAGALIDGVRLGCLSPGGCIQGGCLRHNGILLLLPAPHFNPLCTPHVLAAHSLVAAAW